MFLYNLKLIIRRLKNNKLYSLLNISGFAIGFSVVLIIAMFIFNESTVDQNFSGYKSIYRLVSSEDNDCSIRYEVADALTSEYPEIEYASPAQYLTGFSFTIGSEGEFATLNDIISTDNDFFRIFGLRLLSGFSGDPFSEKNSAVISSRLAGLLFGDISPLGKSIDVGGFIKTRITGVVEDFPENTSFFSDLYLNIEDENLRIMQSGDNGVMWNPASIFVRLNEGISKENLYSKLAQSELQLTYKRGTTWLQPLIDIYFDKQVKSNVNRSANTSMIYLFLAIALLILFLSIANHVNFSIALQFSRLKETGIKKTFGAGVGQLIWFHLRENLAGIILSFIAALLIVLEAMPLAGGLLDRKLDMLDMARFPVNILIVLILIMVVFLTSIVPVYLIRRFDIYRFISGLAVRTKGGFVNKILSVFQSAVSIILVICFITIFKQLSFARQTELGFDKDKLIRIKLPGNFEKGDILKQEYSRLSFVEAATLSLGTPGMINSRAGSGEPDNQFMLNCIETDEDFIPTFKIKLLKGRNFRENDRDTICIINEAALKQYGWENIDNRKFKNYGLTIVGVVNDFNVASLHEKIEPAVLIFKDRFRNTLSLRLSAGNTGDQISRMKEVWDEIMPDNKFDFVFYDDFFNSLYRKEEKEASAITIFSVLALVITLMGMIGLVFQSTLARSKEIGIRKINGAGIMEIMIIINKSLFRMMTIAFLIAVPVSFYAMNNWLQNFAYRTGLNWWIFAAGGLIVLAISAITLSWQSWRAATRNPVEALRYE